VFEVGFGEVMLIGIVALLVLGPQRLPPAARFVGLWVGRLRRQWDAVKQDLETELQAEELRRNLQSVRTAVEQTKSELSNTAAQTTATYSASAHMQAENTPILEPQPVQNRPPTSADSTVHVPKQ